MAFGKSLTLRYFDRDNPIEPRETKLRDRSLIGKARIKARKKPRPI